MTDHRRSLSIFAAGLLCSCPLAAQGLKEAIDGSVRSLRPPLQEGKASATTTGKYLVALARSHRVYTIADGPIVRAPLGHLFRSRTEEGGFAMPGEDAVTATRWAAEALVEVHPERPPEVATAIKFLARQQVTGPFAARPFEESVVAAAKEMAAAPEPKAWLAGRSQQLLGAAAGAAAGAGGAGDLDATVDRLLALVRLSILERPDVTKLLAALQGQAASQPAERFEPFRQKALDYLMTQQKDGVWSVKTRQGEVRDWGVTALSLAAAQTKPVALRSKEESETIRKGLTALAGSQNVKDPNDLAYGSFGQGYANYTTCAAVMALAAAGDKAYAENLEKAQKYILRIQNVEHLGYPRTDRDYGSIGYGGSERGDMNNTQMALEALRTTGLDAQNEAFAKALVFLTRTQNLQKSNDFVSRVKDEKTGEWVKVAPGDDGGSAYYPGNSAVGYDKLADGTVVARSYGSMTYALLKAYILCGVPKDDPRMVAARKWIEQHFTVSENPGSSPDMGDKAKYQGLFFYYLTMARTLHLMGMKTVKDGKGVEHDWSKVLSSALEKMQRADGSWVNDKNDRWWENSPVLCTAYALIALDDAAKQR